MKKTVFILIFIMSLALFSAELEIKKVALAFQPWAIYYEDSCDQREWKVVEIIHLANGYIYNLEKKEIGWYFLIDSGILHLEFFGLISIQFDISGIEKNKPCFHGGGTLTGGCIDRTWWKYCKFVMVSGWMKKK